MAKTVKERVRAWREKKSRDGGRSLSAWLEPETAQMFRSLQEHFGETTSPLVARAIETLYKISLQLGPDPDPIRNRDREAPLREPAPPEGYTPLAEKQSEEPKVMVPPDSCEEDPGLAQMVAKLSAGVPFKEIKGTLLVAWMEAMKAQGVGYDEMAERLNAAQIPTLAGKGKWQGGMIPAFLLLKGSL